MKKLTCILMLSVTIASANPERTVDLPGGPTMDFVWIEPGAFTMGSPESEPKRYGHEGP